MPPGEFRTSAPSKLAKLRKTGVRRAIASRGSYYGLSLLRLYFGFDRWHAGSGYAGRPYKKFVVDLVNSLEPKVAVELGCGLGDIISRLKAAERVGIDPDPAVIRAARFLHRFGGTRWLCGDAATISTVAEGQRINCLLAIGWVHFLSPEDLAKALIPHVKRTDYLVLDRFNHDLRPGRYDHDFAFLDGLAKRLSESSPPDDDIRQYIVFKTNR